MRIFARGLKFFSILIIASLILLGFSFFQNKISPRSIEREVVSIDLNQIATDLNNARKDKNLPSVKLVGELNVSADKIVEQINENNDPNKVNVPKSLGNYLYNKVTLLQLESPRSSSNIVSSWQDDEGARNVIFDPKFTQLGLSQNYVTLSSKKVLVVVAIFIEPAGVKQVQKTQATNNKPNPSQNGNYTSDDLWSAIILYRQSHGLPSLSLSSSLCSLADYRLNQLVALGNLDHHQGFKDYMADDARASALGYSEVGENLALTPSFPHAVAVVEWGWNFSEPHKELLLDSTMTDGCARTKNAISVFIAGHR